MNKNLIQTTVVFFILGTSVAVLTFGFAKHKLIDSNQCLLKGESYMQSYKFILTTEEENRNQQEKTDYQNGQIDPEEYVIYSNILDETDYIDNKTRLAVIKDHTSHSSFIDLTDLKSSINYLSQDTINDYQSKNTETSSLKGLLNLKVKYLLISKGDVDRIFHKGPASWELFYKKYRGAKGLITLSRVGFDSDKTQALVHVVISCDWTCGNGQFIFLKKDANKWHIETMMLTSIS